MSEPIPAATVVLVRDGVAGIETLMLHRNSKIAFGGMWVFPGGRIDDADRDQANPRDDEAAARRAAVREAAEETALVVVEDDLVPFAHWTPPAGWAPKRFSTWFFLAPAPTGAVTIDGGEIHDHRWLAPQEALDRRDRGEVELAPPTWVTLWRLARAGTVEAALDEARSTTPERFVTNMARSSEGLVCMWHGDAGYESGDPDAPGARHRLFMSGERWRYERTA